MEYLELYLTPEEKEYRLQNLKKEIEEGDVDEGFIPFLERINAYSFIVTTQCCQGHEGKANGHNRRRAHFDFRSLCEPQTVVVKLLKPMLDKFDYPSESYIGVDLLSDNGALRYCIWLDNSVWKEQVEYFISLLEDVRGY